MHHFQDPVLVLLTSLIILFLISCGNANEISCYSFTPGRGLRIFITDDFILSLKLSLIGKIFNQSFSHTWKDIIVINQLRYLDNPLISVENGRVGKNSIFT